MRKTADSLPSMRPLEFDRSCVFLLRWNYENLFQHLSARPSETLFQCKGCGEVVKRWERRAHWERDAAAVERQKHKKNGPLLIEREAQYAELDDVTAVVGDVLRGNLDGIQLTLNLGLMASKIANHIKAAVFERSPGVPPICKGCAL